MLKWPLTRYTSFSMPSGKCSYHVSLIISTMLLSLACLFSNMVLTRDIHSDVIGECGTQMHFANVHRFIWEKAENQVRTRSCAILQRQKVAAGHLPVAHSFRDV